MTALHEALVLEAKAAGFPLAGSVDLDLALAGAFSPHLKKFDGWLAQGFEGAMSYLARGRDRRADPRLVFPEAESVFSVALPYSKLPGGKIDTGEGPRHARYLDGPDYHLELAARLTAVLESVNARLNETDQLRWKICVDTSAVLERSWAALAGLGWIGKNTLLINPTHGSYLFVAEALLNRKTGQGPAPLPDFCGHCTRCLTACPTQAFPAPHELNANRCISYWTLEKRGPLDLSDDDRQAVGTWVAGCDVCQEVCPFNQKVTRAAESEPDLRVQPLSWAELLDESEVEYILRVNNSALKRVKPAQFRRNLAIALSNAFRDPHTQPKLRALVPRIVQLAATEPDETVRAEWLRLIFALPGSMPLL